MRDNNSTELELRVVSGLHTGASMSLADRETLLIGSEDLCDILLLDEGVESRHLSWVKREGRWYSENDKLPVPVDNPIKVGSAFVMLCHQNKGAQFEHAPVPDVKKRKRLYVVVILILLLIVSIALSVVIHYFSRNNFVKASELSRPVKGFSQENDKQSIRIYVERQLNERGLSDFVQVKENLTGIMLEGELTESEMESLGRLKLIIQERYGPSVTVEETITLLSEKLPFQISAVVFSSTSHVVLSNDTQLFEGQSFMGYRLVAIRPDRMLWEGARKVEVPW